MAEHGGRTARVGTAAALGLALVGAGVAPVGATNSPQAASGGGGGSGWTPSVQQLLAKPQAPSDPVLWQGTLRDSSGKAAPGVVALYARGNDVPSDTLSGGGSGAMVSLGAVNTDSSGAFTVRVPWANSLQGVTNADGNIDVVAVSRTGSGQGSIGINTMRWLPDQGRWIPAAQAAAGAPSTGAASASASLATGMVAPGGGVVSDLHSAAAPPLAGGAATVPAANSVPNPSYQPCTEWGRSQIADSQLIVGGSNIVANGTNWDLGFTYQNTGTTSEAVGFTAAYSGVWSANGSSTRSSSVSVTAEGHLLGTSQAIARKYWIRTATYKYDWRCWFDPSPPPAYPGNWPQYETVEKGPWVSDFASGQNSQTPSCTAPIGSHNDFGVSPTAVVTKQVGTYTGFNQAFTVGIPEGNGVPFSGGATISTSKYYGATVDYSYRNNNATNTKHLCGTSDNPIFGNTWVLAGLMSG